VTEATDADDVIGLMKRNEAGGLSLKVGAGGLVAPHARGACHTGGGWQARGTGRCWAVVEGTEAKANAIDAAVFDLKAVNPNAVIEIDTRPPRRSDPEYLGSGGNRSISP
jgi:hypothetical protein